MTDDQVRALLIVGALLSGASGTGGFVGGRMSVPVPPPEVRYVAIPAPLALVAPVEAAPIEPAPVLPVEPAPAIPVEPPTVTAAPVEVKPLPLPLPPPRPKIDAKPKEQPKPPPPKKPRPAVASRAVPSCAVIKREYDSMTWPERMAAYRIATPQEIAQGKRCLGF